MANLLPEKIKQLDGLGLKDQVRTIYDYVEYMQEQLEWYSTSKHLNDVYDMYQTIQGMGQRFEVMEEEIEQKEAEVYTALDQAKQEATQLLTTANGGYVAFVLDQDDKPTELVIMDTDDINTAQKVWRWNINGLGYSSTGYNGTFGLAITMNGAIVADYITTGHLSADRIQGGTMRLGGVTSGGAHNYGNGSLEMYDASESLIGSWSRDGITINKGEFNLGNGYFRVSSTGRLFSKEARIYGRLIEWYRPSTPIYSDDQTEIIGGIKFTQMYQGFINGGYGYYDIQDETQYTLDHVSGYIDFLEQHTYTIGSESKFYNDLGIGAIDHDLILSAAWKIRLESDVALPHFSMNRRTGKNSHVLISSGTYRVNGDLVVVAFTVTCDYGYNIDEIVAAGLPIPKTIRTGVSNTDDTYTAVLSSAAINASDDAAVLTAFVDTGGNLRVRTATSSLGGTFYIYGFYIAANTYEFTPTATIIEI